MHCWCPPATGPNQPHEKDCYQYRRPSASYSTSDASGLSGKLSGKFHTGPFFGHGLQYQVQAYHAMAPLSIECTCAAASGVIGHAAFCPMGDGTAPESAG
jgi:hypothetical protein